MSFTPFGAKKQSRFDQEKTRLLDQLSTISIDTPQYTEAVKNYDALCKTATYNKDGSLSPDVILTVVANILGIVMIITFEERHVITTKALNFIVKPKIQTNM